MGSLFTTAQLAGLLKTAVVPQSVSVKFPTRDENHRLLLAKMQGKRLCIVGMYVMARTFIYECVCVCVCVSTANMAKSKQMSNLVVAKERDALTVAKRK